MWLNRNVNGMKRAIRTHYGRILIWKTSRNKDIDGNRWKNAEGTGDGTNQKTTEGDGTDGNSKNTRKGSGTGGNVAGRPENDGESPRKYGT